MSDINIAKSRNFLLKESIELDEMAKIQGELKDAISKVISDNPTLQGLALKKAIKGDQSVIDALAGDDLYDNQLNKFIASEKGERSVGTRGRTPSEAGVAKKDAEQDDITPISTDLNVGEEDEEIIDTWNEPEEEDEEGTPVVDKSLEKEIPSDVGAANNYKNIIVKKVAKIEALPPQEQASSPDMKALKQFILKPEVNKTLGKETIRSLVSSLIG